ncbi:hypothetical protein M601_021550 [Cellulophaga baltica 4]|nr:hypothetical protein M601_021550 [Cellulophaga baltica 4]
MTEFSDIEFDVFFKEEDAFCEVFIKVFNQNIDVNIDDFKKNDSLSNYAKRGLNGIQNITEIQKNKIINDFWKFAKNCMSDSNYEGDNLILEKNETQLERSMKMLKIYNKKEAFSRCKIIFSVTSNNEFRETEDTGNYHYHLWFDCPWDSHYTVVEFYNGEISGYSSC